MRIFFSALFIIIFISCDQNRDMENRQEIAIDSSAINANIIKPEREITLSPPVTEITENWLAFLTAQSEMDNFDSYTVKDVSANATPIAEIMQNLRETSPKQFETQAVQTRLSVLYTKAKVLEYLSKKRTPDYAAIKTTAEELPVEFNNFKIQLNELFLETLEDLEDELDAFDVEDTTSRPLLRTVPGSIREN